MKRKLTFLFSILLIVLCFSASVLAQETGGEIQGTIKDPQGAVVPNVTLTISGVDVGFNRTIQTDADGFFRARQIPPGIYRVTAAATAGFVEQVRENVQVALGNVTTLDFTLGTSVSGVVNVTTDDSGVIVDPTETKAQDNLSARDIDTLPKGTGFASLLNRTSSVRSDAISGQFTINGATGPENSFIVDGQEVQNFRTGVLNTANDIPYQSVQEIQVRTSGFEAEFGGATGGVINVVTKSGTNDFRGEMGLMFNTAKLNAGPRMGRVTLTGGTTVPTLPSQQLVEYVDQPKDRGTDFFPSLSLGGPIIKDKMWFYGIYSPRFFNTTRTARYFSPDLPQNRTFVGQFDATSKSVQEYGMIKLDASPTNTIRLSSSFTWNPYYDEGLLPARTTFSTTIPSTNINGQTIGGADYYSLLGGRQNSNNFRAEAIWTPNSKLVTSLRYARGFLNEKLNSYGIVNAPRIQCVFTAIPAGNPNYPNGLTVAQLNALAGCTQGQQTNLNNDLIVRDVSVRNTVDANASYLTGGFLGQHEFKGGYQYSKISNDVESGFAQTGLIRLCYGRFNPSTCLFNGVVPAGVFNNVNAPLGVGQLYRFGEFGKAANIAHTIFLQDKWQPTSRLTFNLGLRAEQESLPSFNGYETNLKFDFTEKLTPRLGVAYALTSDNKTKLSAFYGWFYDRLKFELPRGSFGGNIYYVDTFAINPAAPNFGAYSIGSILATTGSTLAGACPIANAPLGQTRCQINFRVPSNVPGLQSAFGEDVPSDAGTVDPDLKPFRQSEFTMEFQREVMRSSVFTARYLYRNVDSAVEDSGFLTDQLSEFYDIANPCEGMHLRHIQELGYERCVKAKRTYKALQLEYDTRFIRNFNLNLSYTFSSLRGTYSGLANPDEETNGVGRLSPGVNRYFDQPFVGFNASGGEDYGVLPLDRPHVFKASGTYSFDWLGSRTNSTDLSFFTTAQSGTPQTTFVHGFVGIIIPLGERGDMGRTEMFTQTDFNFTHRYRFGRDNRFTLAMDFNVLNAFNEANVIALDDDLDGLNWNFAYTDVAPNFVDAVNILTSSGVRNQINATQGTPQTQPSRFNPGYGQPIRWQGPRTVRFGFRLLF